MAARPQRVASIRKYAASPEGRAQLAEARKAGLAKSILIRTKAHWPEELRQKYRHLTRVKHIPAAEALAIMLPEVPGTKEHARRQIENIKTKQRIRHARERAQAY